MRGHRGSMHALAATGLLKEFWRGGIKLYSSAEVFIKGVKLDVESVNYASRAADIRHDHVVLRHLAGL